MGDATNRFFFDQLGHSYIVTSAHLKSGALDPVTETEPKQERIFGLDGSIAAGLEPADVRRV